MPPEHRTRRLKRLNVWRLRSQMGEVGILDELRAARKEFPADHPRSYMVYLLLRAELELEEQLWDEARAHARTVLEEARSRQDPFFEATAQIVLGNLDAKGGNSRGAHAALLEARQRAAGLGNQVLRADIELSRAELAVDYPELGDDPRTLLESAKQVFLRGRLRPRIEKASRLEQRLQPARAESPVRPVKELATLYRASEIIRSSRNRDDLLEKLLDGAIELMGADRGIIFLVGSRRTELSVAASRGADRATARDAGQISRGIVRRALQDAEPIFSTNAMNDERFRQNRSVADYQIRSFICAPLLLPDRTIGTLYVDHRKVDHLLREEDARFLMAYGSLAAAAIENALHEGRLRRNPLLIRPQLLE